MERLGECEITRVCQWRLDKSLHYSKILKPVAELGIGDFYREGSQWLVGFGSKVESQLPGPHELCGSGVGRNASKDVSKVDKLNGEMLTLLACNGIEIREHSLGENVEHSKDLCTHKL